MDISESSGYRDFIWAIELNRFGLKLIGLWPKSDEVARERFICDLRMGIIFIAVTFVCGIPLTCALIRVWGDMILMLDNLQITLPLAMISLKLIIMRWKRTAILLIVKMIEEDWVELKGDTERKVMIRRAQIARLIVIIGYVLMIILLAMVVILPCCGLSMRHLTNLTDRAKPLPLQTYYHYDTDKSPQFELTFTVQVVTCFVAAVVYTSVDSFLALAVLHICGQLENFKHRLTTFTSSKDFNSALSDNVMTHLRLIRFVDYIEETFTIMMLGLVFYFGIVFCLYGFLLLTVSFTRYIIQIFTDENINSIPFSRICFVITGVITLFTHTFLYCGAGEMMATQCEAVYRAICDLKWYKMKPKKAKALILLMLRANEPFRLTAGKMFPLTMTTFCSLLKTSAGYISFLLAMQR